MDRIQREKLCGTQNVHTQSDDFVHAKFGALKEKIKDLPDYAPEKKEILNEVIFILSQAKRFR